MMRASVPVAVVASTLVSVTTAADEQSVTAREQQLLDRISHLESRLSRVESREQAEWIDERRGEEIRAIVQDVLADTATRSSLLQSGMTGGWDNGFFLASADGNYRLNIQGQMQFRFLFSNQSNSPEDDTRYGFENSRTQLIFTGHIVDPTWIYRVQGNFSRDGGTFGLEDAFIGKVLGNGWTLLAGQFRVPMLREFLVTEPRQQFVERSLMHQEFTAGRTQGVAIDYRNDVLHFTGGFTDGHPATGGFNSPTFVDGGTDFSLTGRLEVLAAGNWDQFNDFASMRGGEFGTLIGGAIHWQKGESGTADPELQVVQWTVDAQVEFDGANLFIAFVGRHLDDDAAVDLDQYGFIIQAGAFLTDDWEIFARYEWGDDDGMGKDVSIITAGVTRYFNGHRLKWTSDIGYGINEVSATWADGFLGAGGGMAGWREDAPGEDGQIVVRSQIQLLF